MTGFDPPPNDMIILEPKFPLGSIYATACVTAWAARHEIELTHYIRRHHCGQWGDLDAEDKQSNEDALRDETRIFSAYKIAGKKIYIVTEADRSMTTIMLATEY